MLTEKFTPTAHTGEVHSWPSVKGGAFAPSVDEYFDVLCAARRVRLRMLIDRRAGGNVPQFAREVGLSRSQIYQFLSPTYGEGRSIGELAARRLELAAGLPFGWLDCAPTGMAGDAA